uniref:Uncharacterized protein n=1 Tax=Trichobilharzia regenti TaxID=157069 RepID=A0AA85JSM3_TRIRE|nr:unnamed protein product [Trichobilharzia regenti]
MLILWISTDKPEHNKVHKDRAHLPVDKAPEEALKQGGDSQGLDAAYKYHAENPIPRPVVNAPQFPNVRLHPPIDKDPACCCDASLSLAFFFHSSLFLCLDNDDQMYNIPCELNKINCRGSYILIGLLPLGLFYKHLQQ